ncbi:MAG: ADP-forming succinate--CoA ligase subunit beta [Deltaproteobacteria bacterium]|nr:ADP-forming succinate--CoA ligase subunit beta [Deltaproteobacteria bacterium]
MNVHEYQAKELLSRYGVAVPAGKVASSPEGAEAIAKDLGGSRFVVKAQIHAGGRGKGGGVKLGNGPAEVRRLASEILGMQLVTHQTGPEGKLVQKVLIEEGCDIARECYLGVVVDRMLRRPVVMASTEGGVEIEKVAAETPEKILKEVIDPAVGLQPFQARKLAFGLGLSGPSVNKMAKFLDGLYKLFVDKDCSLVEINPLVVTSTGDLLALDAKFNFDDNALFRHPDIEKLRDPDEEDPREREAKKFDLSYIALDGNIGCMVNGAGLAMATMDAIQLYGGTPANFLDVGGGADTAKIREAFKLILADSSVKAVLVNIFGGILKCDVLAKGIVEAGNEVHLSVPLVVRMEGTNVEDGKRILAESNLRVIAAKDIQDAAQQVIAAAKAGGAS